MKEKKLVKTKSGKWFLVNDLQTKKGRLSKRDYKADFRLADNDDFMGLIQMTIRFQYGKK